MSKHLTRHYAQSHSSSGRDSPRRPDDCERPAARASDGRNRCHAEMSVWSFYRQTWIWFKMLFLNHFLPASAALINSVMIWLAFHRLTVWESVSFVLGCFSVRRYQPFPWLSLHIQFGFILIVCGKLLSCCGSEMRIFTPLNVSFFSCFPGRQLLAAGPPAGAQRRRHPRPGWRALRRGRR